jgi:pyridinium-3,5-bisthiocarboxylic acid mononucleotide nickel chelatase
MTKSLYFDCFSGCSGDMIIGALLDAGVSLEELKKGLNLLGLDGYQLKAEKVLRSSISSMKFNVVMEEHDHHHHRGLTEIIRIIDSSQLPDIVKKKSIQVFNRLGEVEAGIHGAPLEEVHFHELGAVDSIIDIVGAILALDILKIERFYSSGFPAGAGTVNTAHGILPVPAPATLKLMALAGTPVISNPGPSPNIGELVTPTGAALITSLAEFHRPELRIEKVGYGAGNKDFQAWPNIMRVWIGEEIDLTNVSSLVLLETNIDDMNPQIYGYLMDKLLEEKALDVWFTPIQMKKNRPAVMLSVLAAQENETTLSKIILSETSTLGIRIRQVDRHEVQRKLIEFASSLGKARAKVKIYTDLVTISPEYEDCRRIASERQLPLHEVSRIIESEARRYLETHPLT